MLTTCPTCGLIYNNTYWRTYCPHTGFAMGTQQRRFHTGAEKVPQTLEEARKEAQRCSLACVEYVLENPLGPSPVTGLVCLSPGILGSAQGEFIMSHLCVSSAGLDLALPVVADLLEACAARGEPDEPCIQAVADARAKVLEAIALLEEHAQQTT